jgi:hypothetical protein
MTGKSKRTRQKSWLEAFKANSFNISKACLTIGIDRSTYYRWMNDPDFTKSVKDAREEKIDFIESQLFRKIADGDTTSIIFALKTLGKKRGYIERKEISGPEGSPLPSIDVKVLLQNPEIRVALETIARKFSDGNQKAIEPIK